MSPTQRTLAALRADGWLAEVVERYNRFSRTRHDLFGGIDIVAIKHQITLGVQCTSGANHAARVTKLAALPEMALWLASDHRQLQVWSWSKHKVKRGGKQVRWTARVARLVLAADRLVPVDLHEELTT
jgi:hypothetical protein